MRRVWKAQVPGQTEQNPNEDNLLVVEWSCADPLLSHLSKGANEVCLGGLC